MAEPVLGRLTLKKVTSFNELTIRAIRSGVNQLKRIEMKSSMERELRQRALIGAIQDAKARAELIAREVGRQLGEVTTVATDDAEVRRRYGAGNSTVTVHAERVPAFSVRVFMTCSIT